MTKLSTASISRQKSKNVSKRGKSKERGNSTGTVFKLPNGRYRWQVTLGFDQHHKQIRASGVEADKTKASKADQQFHPVAGDPIHVHLVAQHT